MGHFVVYFIVTVELLESAERAARPSGPFSAASSWPKESCNAALLLCQSPVAGYWRIRLINMAHCRLIERLARCRLPNSRAKGNRSSEGRVSCYKVPAIHEWKLQKVASTVDPERSLSYLIVHPSAVDWEHSIGYFISMRSS